MYVCLLACLDRPLTISHFWLLFCVFSIMRYFKKGSRVGVEDMNHEQPTSSTSTTSTETTHQLTYTVARAIEVTAWQSVDAVCHGRLTHGSCHWTQISFGYSNGGYWQRMSKNWLECFHLSMPSPYDLRCVLDQPVCSMLCQGLTHSSCDVYREISDFFDQKIWGVE